MLCGVRLCLGLTGKLGHVVYNRCPIANFSLYYVVDFNTTLILVGGGVAVEWTFSLSLSFVANEVVVLQSGSLWTSFSSLGTKFLELSRSSFGIQNSFS